MEIGNWQRKKKNNILDITGWTNFIIEGNGCLDGNISNQTGATYPQTLGGIVSNISGTQDTTTGKNSNGDTITIPPMPVSSKNPITTKNGIIRNIEIKNCWNWPINLAYIENVVVENCNIHDSSSSPQFFDSALNCTFKNNTVYNITDGGFVFYRGNNNCFAYGNIVHDCHDGIGVYSEYDMLNGNENIIIQNNIVYNNRDSGIGITTGLTPPKLIQKNISILDNILYNNNTGGRDGGGSIGIVGATGITIKNNIIYNDGQGLTVTTPSYGIFVDSKSENIIIENNTLSDIGCATGLGFGIYCSGTNNITIRNNTGYNTDGATGVMKALYGGSLGTNSFIENNIILSELNGFIDEIDKPDALILQRDSTNNYQISNDINLINGNINFNQDSVQTNITTNTIVGYIKIKINGKEYTIPYYST